MWVDKLWHIMMTEYYSVLKRNKPSSHEKAWKKVASLKKLRTVWFPLYDILEKS